MKTIKSFLRQIQEVFIEVRKMQNKLLSANQRYE